MLVDKSLKNINQILNLHKSGVPVYGVYFVCVSPLSRHLVEVIEAACLLQEHNSKKAYEILGAAPTRRSAFELVRRIVQGFVDTGGEFEGLKSYLLAYGGGNYASE